jgi:hypothetical protein
VRAGLERPQAAIALWLLSGFFALCAVLIPITNKMTEQFVSAIAALIWVGLFTYFFRTPDSE